MPKRVRTGLTRSDILDRYVERFKQQLVKFQPFLSRKRGSASLEDFDEAAEELIGQVFGAASDESESYFYAKTGESATPARRSARKRNPQCGARESPPATASTGKLLGRSRIASTTTGNEKKEGDRDDARQRLYVA